MRSLIWTLQWLLYNYVFFELHWCGSLASIKKQICNLRGCGYQENIESCGPDSVISVSLDLLGNHNKWTESSQLLKQEARKIIILQGAMRNEETALCFTPLSFQLILSQLLGLCLSETVTAEDYQYWDKQRKLTNMTLVLMLQNHRTSQIYVLYVLSFQLYSFMVAFQLVSFSELSLKKVLIYW